MAVVFQHVLRVSLFTTPAILLLLLLRPHLARRYSARLRCFVWMLVIARLLVPVHFSLRGLFRDVSPAAKLLDRIDQNAVAAALSRLLDGGEASITAGPTAPSFAADWRMLGGVWLMAAALFLCVHLVAYRVTMKRLRRWSMPVTDPLLLAVFEETKRRFSITRDVALYQTAQPILPMLTGLLRPRIYLPARELSASECAAILSHELCHYRRGDLWLKLALLLVHAVHWFNPVLFFLLRQIELDTEMACDQDVLRGADPFARQKYGLAVLSFLDEAQPVPAPLTTHFYGGKKQMKARFTDMISRKKKKTGVLFAACVALAVVFSGAWTGNVAMAADGRSEDTVTVTSTVTMLPRVVLNGDAKADTLTVSLTDDGEEVIRYIGRYNDATGEYVLQPANAETNPDTAQAALAVAIGSMVWPAPDYYTVGSPFGERYGGADFHTGIDLRGENMHGAEVIAAEAGTVAFTNTTYTPGVGYGIYLVIDHGGDVSTLYAHLSEILVKEGDTVEKGQVIAKIGSTGYAEEPHLHFEVREKGVAVDPVPFWAAGQDEK